MKSFLQKFFMIGIALVPLCLRAHKYDDTDEYSCTNDSSESYSICSSSASSKHAVQLRASYYRPSSDIMREVYPHAIVDWGIEGSRKLPHHNEVWGAVDWVSKHGCSLCFEEKSQTRLSFVSISAGVKHLFNIRNCLQFYLGAGPAYTFMHIHDKYPYVQEHVSDYGLGALFKGGFRFTRSHIFLEFFTDYFLQHISPTWFCDNNVAHCTANLNGIRVGGSIGFKF